MNSWSPERIADRLQIQEVLYRYCRAIDRIQTDILASVFHPDAIVDKGDDRGSVTDFIAAVAARHPGVPHASHMVTNMLIDFLGVDSAFVERSEEHTSELQSLMRISYAVFCLKKKNNQTTYHNTHNTH